MSSLDTGKAERKANFSNLLPAHLIKNRRDSLSVFPLAPHGSWRQSPCPIDKSGIGILARNAHGSWPRRPDTCGWSSTLPSLTSLFNNDNGLFLFYHFFQMSSSISTQIGHNILENPRLLIKILKILSSN